MDLSEPDKRISCENDNSTAYQSATCEVKQKADKKVSELSKPPLKKPSCEQCPDSILVYEPSVGACVCENCGKVYDTVYFSHDIPEHSTFVGHGFKTVQLKKKNTATSVLQLVQDKTRGHRACVKIIDIVCSQYHVGKEGKRRVLTLFDEEYPIIKNKSNEFKEAVALALIYKVVSDVSHGVSILDLINITGCKQKLFSQALKYVKTRYGLFTPSIENTKDSLSKQLSLNSSELVRSVLKYKPNEIFENGKKFENFIQKAQNIFKLAEKCWLSTGRSPSALIIACGFYAYKSYLIEHCKPNWKKMNFREFCKLFNIAERRTAAARVTELKALFTKLFTEYVKKNGHISTGQGFLPYTTDIVLFSKTLTESYWETLKCDSKKGDVSSIETETSMAFRRSSAKRLKLKEPSKSKITEEQAIYLNGLRDEDIMDDEELVSYIKTPEEIQQTKEVKAKALAGKSLYVAKS